MDEALLMQEGSSHTSEQKGGLYAHMCMQAAFLCEDDCAYLGAEPGMKAESLDRA
jgi:hypothetical protein